MKVAALDYPILICTECMWGVGHDPCQITRPPTEKTRLVTLE